MRNQWVFGGIFVLLGAVVASILWGIGLTLSDDELAERGSEVSTIADEVDDESAEEPAAPTLASTDFKVSVSITDRECFGSAGCNIEFAVRPEYVGFEDPSDGHYLVTYEVRGVEDGPQIGSFELEGDSLSFEPDGAAQTVSPSQKISAVVTGVELLPY